MENIKLLLAQDDITRIKAYLDVGVGEVNDILIELCNQADKGKE